MAVLVYVASPYTRGDKEMNLIRHKLAGNELISAGYVPILPLLYHYQDKLFPQPYETWLQIDLEILRRCDCVLRLEGDSDGADAEVEFAKGMYLPVFYTLDELNKYWNE